MKFMFLATNDNKMHLFHILLNAINYHELGNEIAVVLECASPKLLIDISKGTLKMPLFFKAKELGLIDHSCMACTDTFSATEAAKSLGISLKGDLSGHSNLHAFSDRGYSIITF
ncbi:MAG: cytoplasmic protein [Candidatus Lokiarchaeota archaeon]|nr:cytoplasmic protein [Candidatus Lokiarchaeota archaeon]